MYGGANGSEPTYGLMFQGTGTFGTHGSVTADWATYFTMNSTPGRGWIFRDVTNGNVASISNSGNAAFNGTISSGAITATNLTLTDNGVAGGIPLLKISADDSAPWALQLYREDLLGGPQIYASDASTFSMSGHVDIRSGFVLRMNGSLVIDNSKNISAGTITSGAITSTGSSTVDTLTVGTGSNTGVLNLKTYDDAANTWNLYVWNDDTLRFNYNGSGADEFVLNSSGNATFTGTISSGAITSSGNITLAEYLYHSGNTGTNLRFLTNRAILTSGGGASVDAHSNSNLYLTGTTIVGYGNYTSTGTISSGAITSTGISGTSIVQSIRNPSTSWSQYALTRYGSEGANVRYMDFGYYRGASDATRGLVIKSQANATLFTFLDTGELISSGAVNVASGTSNRFGGDTFSGSVGMYDNGNSAYQTPVLVIRKDATQTGGLNTAPVSLFIHNGVGKWVKLSLGARETDAGGNTVSIAGIASERTAGTLNAWATGNLHLWTKSASTQITNMILKSNGNAEIPGGDLEVRGTVTLNHTNSGNKYLTLNKSNGGDGHILFQENLVYKWQNATNGTDLQWYSYTQNGPIVKFGGTGGINLLYGGYEIAGTTVIDSARNITAVNATLTGVTNLTSAGNQYVLVASTSSGEAMHRYGNTTSSYWYIGLRSSTSNSITPTGYHIYSAAAGVTVAGWNADKNFYTSGNITAVGNITAYSDERLKDRIKTLDGSKVLEMRGVSFTKDGKAGSGVIAQEIERIAPELVEDDGTYKSVAYGNLVGYLIENAKQQQSEIDELKALVKKLMEK